MPEEGQVENKYYTPELSEFHVGFEYEFSGNKGEGWSEEIVEDLYSFESIIDDIRYCDLRVKYLDKEDIESLGFKKENDMMMSAMSGSLYIGKRSELRTWYSGHSTCVRIITNPNTEQKQIVFDGFIKNLSELKVLLKQLGIDG